MGQPGNEAIKSPPSPVVLERGRERGGHCADRGSGSRMPVGALEPQ